MYPIEKQVCTLEQGKELDGLGVKAESYWRECPVCESPAVFQTGACYTCYVCGNSSGSCG